MTRIDLDAHGCRLADLWHDAGTELLKSRVVSLAVTIADGDPAVACYLGARVFDRLAYMGDRGATQHWLDALERWAVVSTGG